MRITSNDHRSIVKAALALTLACALSLAIAACGGGSDDSSGSTNSGSDSAEISGTVTVWDTEYQALPEYTEAIDQIDSEFEKLHPGVKVDRVAQPAEAFPTLFRTASIAGEVPDMAIFQPGANGVLAFSDKLEPLNDRISEEMQENITQWGSTTPGFTEEGEHFGVPVGLNGWTFYYNKKLFKQAGLPVDFKPESWTEVREAGEKLKAAGIQPFVGGNKDGEGGWWFGLGLQTEGTPAEVTELAEGKIPYTDELVAKAFAPTIEMQDAGLYSSERFTTTFVEGFADFAEGKGAMVLGFWNAIGYWGEFNPKLGEQNVGMFPVPGTDSVGTIASFGLSIPKGAENPDAAWALIEFEMSKEGVETLDEVGGFMPNRKDVELPANFPSQAVTLLDEARERENITGPAILIPLSVVEVVIRELNQVMQGRTSLEAMQELMQEAAETGAK